MMQDADNLLKLYSRMSHDFCNSKDMTSTHVDRHILGDIPTYAVPFRNRVSNNYIGDTYMRMDLKRATIEKIVRVDHAGENGAIRIYKKQILGLSFRKAKLYIILGFISNIDANISLTRKLSAKIQAIANKIKSEIGEIDSMIAIIDQEILDEEKHLRLFSDFALNYMLRTTAMDPLWHICANILGFTTGLFGSTYVNICTYAIEDVIATHYLGQMMSLDRLIEDASSDSQGDPIRDLRRYIQLYRDDEIEHRDNAHDRVSWSWYREWIAALIAGLTNIAIRITGGD